MIPFAAERGLSVKDAPPASPDLILGASFREPSEMFFKIWHEVLESAGKSIFDPFVMADRDGERPILA